MDHAVAIIVSRRQIHTRFPCSGTDVTGKTGKGSGDSCIPILCWHHCVFGDSLIYSCHSNKHIHDEDSLKRAQFGLYVHGLKSNESNLSAVRYGIRVATYHLLYRANKHVDLQTNDVTMAAKNLNSAQIPDQN